MDVLPPQAERGRGPARQRRSGRGGGRGGLSGQQVHAERAGATSSGRPPTSWIGASTSSSSTCSPLADMTLEASTARSGTISPARPIRLLQTSRSPWPPMNPIWPSGPTSSRSRWETPSRTCRCSSSRAAVSRCPWKTRTDRPGKPSRADGSTYSSPTLKSRSVDLTAAVSRGSRLMGSPLVIRDAAGGRRDRRRLHRPVHVEALRRIGVEVVGLLGSSPERAVGRGPSGWGSPGSIATSTNCWPTSGWASSTSPRPTRTTSSRPGGCWSRAATWSARSRWRPPRRRPRPCGRWPSRGRRRRRRSITTSAIIRSAARSASGSPRGAGAGAQRHRVVRPGLAALSRRLQLAGRGRRPDEPPRRGRHRHALDGPGPVPDRRADPLRQRRPGHVPPPTAQADRADRHLHRLGRAGRHAAGPGGRGHDRRPRRGPPAVRRGRPGRVPRLAGHRRPQEPADDRDRGHRGARPPGTASRPTGSGSARARGPNQVLARDPALLGPAAAAMAHYPGGHVEGFPDTFKQLYIDVYGWIIEGRAAGRAPDFPTFADGDREVRLCEAIARSAADGRWVSVG